MEEKLKWVWNKYLYVLSYDFKVKTMIGMAVGASLKLGNLINHNYLVTKSRCFLN